MALILGLDGRPVSTSPITATTQPSTGLPMATPTTPQEILQKAAKILEERGGTYGDYEKSMGGVGLLWRDYLGHYHISSRDVAVMLALLKVARMGASPKHMDNYIDAIGYLALAGALADAAAKD